MGEERGRRGGFPATEGRPPIHIPGYATEYNTKAAANTI